MSSGQYTQAQILLIKAAEDEQALKVAGIPDAILSFHAQQAIEKLFKALLATLGLPFELTHSLSRLETVLHAAGESVPATPIPLSDLTDFAVVYRHDLLFQFAAPDVTDLIETVRIVREHIIARIAAISAAP